MPDGPQKVDELKLRACAAVDEAAEVLWETALAIHAHPELGYQEVFAAEQLCTLLQGVGIGAERNVAGLATAFVARVGSRQGPQVAVLAEYDALPGIGHGCGHNLIGTSAVGAALAFRTVAEMVPGGLILVGCPAEESAVDDAGGKIKLLEGGVFDGVAAAIMAHPAIEDYVSVVSSLAASGFEFRFVGRPAHAAAEPHKGINALDGVIQTFNGINAMRQHIRPDARIHGIITDGGASPNIVPEHAACRFRVRAADREYLGELVQRVKNCAQGGASASGARLEIRQLAPMYEETLGNRTLSEAFRSNYALLGRQPSDWPRHEGMGSTDLGNVSQRIPAVSVYAAISSETINGHSREFTAAAASPLGRSMMLDSAKAMVMTVLDLLLKPELMAETQADFLKAHSA